MPDTPQAFRIAHVIIVMLTVIMKAPNQKSFQEGGVHTVYMGAGNPCHRHGARVRHDLGRHSESAASIKGQELLNSTHSAILEEGPSFPFHISFGFTVKVRIRNVRMNQKMGSFRSLHLCQYMVRTCLKNSFPSRVIKGNVCFPEASSLYLLDRLLISLVFAKAFPASHTLWVADWDDV